MRQKTLWKKLQLPAVSEFRAFLCVKAVPVADTLSFLLVASVAPSLIAKCHFFMALPRN